MTHNLTTRLPKLAVKYLKYQVFNKMSSYNTSKSYANDLNQFLTPVGVKKIVVKERQAPEITEILLDQEKFTLPEKISVGDAEGLLRWLIRGSIQTWSELSPASRNRKWATIRSFLRWLFEEGEIEAEMAAIISSPKVPTKLPHYLSLDEVLSLLSLLRQERKQASTKVEEHKAQENLALVLLIYGGGLRVSEACELQWNQVDLNQSIVKVKGKGERERLVVLPRMVIREIRPLLQKNHDFVFGNQALSPRKAYQIIREAGARTGLLKPLHPHALRHSYATHLLSSGTDLRTIQELLGHTSLQATQKYTHLDLNSLARTMESFHPLSKKKPK